jgi:2,3-bisphosphoglycerate-independent phosphoglycerate mutase
VSETRRPLVLAVLDGWGVRTETHGNAIAAAELPNWQRFLATYPHTLLEASGEDVGLPHGIMGNSEVGHINIGSGRVVPQGVVVIDSAIAEGSFAKNPVLQQAIAHVQKTSGTLHFLGLLSDGCVHSSMLHLEALIDSAANAKVPFEIHAFLDGRDTPPRSALNYIDRISKRLEAVAAPNAIATISGRFFAMDRDKRWDRVERAYDALASGKAAFNAPTARAAIEAAYARNENDEFVQPTLIGAVRPIREGDSAIFFNFRPDRARELTLAFTDHSFSHFNTVKYGDLVFATMTRYEENFPNPVLFGPRPQSQTFGEVIAEAGLRQLRLAETEKYAHVTYFFNGGREDVFENEDRILIPSNRKVATYDLAPEMMAAEITTAAIEDLDHKHHDVIVMNYANADMVGHTGVWDATISAVETLDVSLGRLEQRVLARDGILVITSDHGNAEEKIDADGNPLTAHTTSPVPLVIISQTSVGTLANGGKLGDIAPTLLPLMGLRVPGEMTGKNLLA